MKTDVLEGRYYTESLLGRGKIADVYLGQDFRLNRDVVIKVLRTSLARNPQFFSRFIREAQSVAALSHPNIVAVYATGTHTVTDGADDTLDVPFIVMERVEGDALHKHIRRGKMFVRQSASYAEGLLGALGCGHRAGIVHRDVRPANIIIDKAKDMVKVKDFGIAQNFSPSATDNGADALESALYISPEQARGELVDARSDLYSAAVIFYEMLAGRPPFTGSSAVEVAFQHVSEIPPLPSAGNPDVPKSLDFVVMKALSKNPDERFETAADFAEALNVALKEKLGWYSAYSRAALNHSGLTSDAHPATASPDRTDIGGLLPPPKSTKIFSAKVISGVVLATAALLAAGAWLAP